MEGDLVEQSKPSPFNVPVQQRLLTDGLPSAKSISIFSIRNQHCIFAFRSRQPHGTNISIVWSLRQFEKNSNCFRVRSKRISCRRLWIPILKISHQLPSPSRWSGILLRGLSPLTRIRSLGKISISRSLSLSLSLSL